ncbi:MAG TPA: zinc-dependent metalloprotease family protein [Pyrinomonadaceae bacterium]|jgi:hypothetical protein|nr:zinc-dependent metalloprotease family protein [Pyrinomonadaceae bacterium]
MYTKWNHKVVFLLVAIVAFSTLAVTAQQKIWSVNNENRARMATDKAVARQSYPNEFKLFNLNIDPLREQLFSVVDGRMNSTLISLPNADGNIEYFEVYESSNFEPDLQAQFPEIRAYSGRGVTDRYATLKLSISPQGIQTMVFRVDKDNEFIEPYSKDHTVYSVFRTNRQGGGLPWACFTKEHAADENPLLPDTGLQKFNLLPNTAAPENSDGVVRTMRLAQSNNGEYAGYYLATTACTPADKALVLGGFNGTLARVNGVQEKDLGIHFNLIAGTTAVIYCDPATDPYGTSIGGWNAALQSTLNANVGAANYDIGHMFGASGGGGNAGCIGCVCNDANKGSGITSPADGIPQGDNFDIDYVVHEMGHQLGANHSFSWSNEGSGVNMEVGSGITIMGYAGITSQDVAPHSIDTFHAGNIAQIQSNLASKTCPVSVTMTANHKPVVAAVPNATIPITTPFALTGSATDPEGDPLTYQWEQVDQTTTSGNASVASPTKATGPNWLSFVPTSSPTRTFPRLSTILSGLFVTPTLPGGDAIANIEALSSVSRTLNFRLTVRDNNPYVAGVKTGQTDFTNTTVTVTNAAGPFKVTSPNTGVTWNGNSNQTVTWDVAGTTANGVNVANVKISFSSDGGQTFPTVLKASTPNDGSESILTPSVNSSTNRIKVEAIGNIFFDISDANFSTTFAPIRARADFDGDGKTDLSLHRPAESAFYLLRSTAGFGGAIFGNPTDVPTPGDFDNDGKTDMAYYRPGASALFAAIRSSNGTVAVQSLGTTGDIPVAGDYDADGATDYAVFRPSNSTWNVIRSSGGSSNQAFGQAGDIPVVGDFDGDGKCDTTVYRSGTWLYLPSASPINPVVMAWGLVGDLPVPADYDGDGKDDIAVYRPSNGVWYIVNSSGGMAFYSWGISTDIPVPGDYDGDGKDDIAIYRNGVWWIYNPTSASMTLGYFGVAGDNPIPRYYQP